MKNGFYLNVLLFVVLVGSLMFFSLIFVSLGRIVYAASVDISANIQSRCWNGVADVDEQCDGSDLREKICADLNFSGGDLDCSATCKFNTTDCATDAEVTGSSSFMVVLGGSYTLTNASNTAKITLPENFYTRNLDLLAFSYDKSVFESTKPAPSGKNFVGKTYDFFFINFEGNTVSTISQPATIVLTYTAADVSGLDESVVKPYRRGSSESSWQLISGATLNTTNKTVTFTATSFGSFALFSSPPQQQTSQERVSAGGGGGIWSLNLNSITLSGRAYPFSKVSILKDGQLAVTTIAGPDAKFNITLGGLSSGNYIFSVLGEDEQGRHSILFSFPTFISSGVMANIGGIFIAPTISTDKTEVKHGENIAILGQTAPKAEVTIAVNSEKELFIKVPADENGSYLYNFDTSQIDFGYHLTKSKATTEQAVSPFGKAVNFLVGTRTIIAQPIKELALRGDLNGDKRVNLVDFSIAAYWYKRVNPLTAADLNSDGKVDLTDFSIMAYYWTG